MATGGGKAEGRAGPKVRRRERTARPGVQETVSGGLAAEAEGGTSGGMCRWEMKLTVLGPQCCLHHRCQTTPNSGLKQSQSCILLTNLQFDQSSSGKTHPCSTWDQRVADYSQAGLLPRTRTPSHGGQAVLVAGRESSQS